MKEIKITVTEDNVVFTVGTEELFIPLSRFLDVMHHDGENIRNEAERIARRFDPLKSFLTIVKIDVLRDSGLSIKDIAARIHISETLLGEFLETQTGYLAAQRSDVSYPVHYENFKAHPSLI